MKSFNCHLASYVCYQKIQLNSCIFVNVILTTLLAIVAEYVLISVSIRGGSRLLKRYGTARCVIIVDVGVASWDMHSYRGLGACLPGNFEKLHFLRLNLRAFSD